MEGKNQTRVLMRLVSSDTFFLTLPVASFPAWRWLSHRI